MRRDHEGSVVGAAPAARRLFGTDGVRGVAGEFLTAELALSLARAATARLTARAGHPLRALVVRDTRESGEMLEAAVAAGIAAAGGEALLGGVLPTPGAPLLIARHGLDLAVVISASHNPYRDNGIKFFGADGYKLSDAVETEIETALELPAAPREPGRVRDFHGALEDYLRALQERFSALDLRGRRILLDTANGATYQAAPEIFRRLGADVGVLADAPDGRNINHECGSTHTRRLQAAMQVGDDEIGFAFDGDGDRVLAVDRTGALVDGDELIALAALHLRDLGRLRGGGVAVTVMTNYGFHAAMAEHGVPVATTAVGDRYVLEELRARDWSLGGEQSGHIIDRDFVPSGDGIAAALLTLEALADRDLAERRAMRKLPQTLVNVRVSDKSLAHAEHVVAAVERESRALAGAGRVLLRPSGTEPLIRVMVEAPTQDAAESAVARLVAVLEAACA